MLMFPWQQGEGPDVAVSRGMLGHCCQQETPQSGTLIPAQAATAHAGIPLKLGPPVPEGGAVDPMSQRGTEVEARGTCPQAPAKE